MSKKTRIEPFVSILTPVYNQKKFLGECIESVLSQTYDNWEYIIVDNCSTDGSLEVAEKYAILDERVRIHNNRKHLPVMKNLNHAFRQISGESKYCKVVHGDDWMFPECISKMVALADKYPGVGIVSSYYIEGNRIGPGKVSFPSYVNNGREISRSFLLGKSNYFGAPSNLLVRSSLIRKRENVYDETYLQSDMSACLDLLRESDFGFVHQVLTYTRRHENSLTNTVAKKKFRYMLGDLKIHLDYGPLFLTDEEHQKVMEKREKIFYIQFARNMIQGELKTAFRRHSEQLQAVNYSVKYGKLLRYLLRESILEVVKKGGIELKRIQNGQVSV